MDNSHAYPLHPPPAYSEEEFCQKTSRALELSTRIHQPDPQWEQWDEAVFEAAVREGHTTDSSRRQSSSRESASQFPMGGSGSSLMDNTQPLRVNKRPGGRTDNSAKPRPSWLNEAESSHSSSGALGPGPSVQRIVTNVTPDDYAWNNAAVLYDVPPGDEDEGDAIAPPPFAPPSDGLVRMSFEPSASPNPSPLASPNLSPRVSLQPNQYLHSQQSQLHLGIPPSPAQFQPQQQPLYPNNPLLHQRPVSQQSNAHPNNDMPVPQPYPQMIPQTLPPMFPQMIPPTLPQTLPQTLPNPYLLPNAHVAQRPVSVPARNSYTGVTNNSFTPMLYQRPGQMSIQAPRVHDPNAFYNSAVSAHLTPISTRPKRTSDPPGHRPQTMQTQYLHPGASYTSSFAPSTHGHATNWSNVPTLSRTSELPDASHYSQYIPSALQPSQTMDTVPRWATSEQDFMASFR